MSLRVDNLSFGYPQDELCLKEVNFEVAASSFVSIVGLSGCGKSTLLKLIGSLLSGFSGQVTFDGSPITSTETLWHPQTDMCLEHKSVMANMTLPADLAGEDTQMAQQRALEHMEAFGLVDIADKWPHQLSVGMRQRVSLARSFMVERPILLLDEPLSAVDEVTRTELQVWLESAFLTSRRTILMVTHDLAEACRMSDQVIAFNSRGEIVCDEHVSVDRQDRSKPTESQNLLELKNQLLSSISS